jgi:hypothetical protein
MLEVNETMISLTKGDTAHLSVEITNSPSGEAYTILADDVVILTIKKQAYETAPIMLQKKVVGSGNIALAPEDTAEMAPGNYKYDVELRSGADVYTVIQCSEFTLLPEVTTL